MAGCVRGREDPPLDDWIQCKEPLERLGYDYAEKAGVPGHFIFGRGRDRTERTHLIHIVEFDGDSWRACVAFRDALRRNESLRAAYLQVKEQASRLAPEGRARYNDLKSSFIERGPDQPSWHDVQCPGSPASPTT